MAVHSTPTPSRARGASSSGAWEARDAVTLLADQLAALDAWNATLLASRGVQPPGPVTRERQLDLAREAAVREREREALLARADAALAAAGGPWTTGGPRAVVAHRSPWFRDKVAARWAERGVEVLALVEDGAQAAAAVVVEQPDLLLVEELLPTLSGVEVLARSRRFSPATTTAAQAADPAGLPALVSVGASAVFTRRIPPVDVADEALDCLLGRRTGVQRA